MVCMPTSVHYTNSMKSSKPENQVSDTLLPSI
jgi:hypothetical protein